MKIVGGEYVVKFDEYDAPRQTVRNLLEYLVADDKLVRRKHANGTVTYRRP